MDIAVVVMASWGDVIISSLIPAAIVQQRPEDQITFYTSSACAGAIANNPHVHRLEIIQANKDQAWGIQDRIIAQARKKHQKVITPWAGFYPQHDWLPLDNQPGDCIKPGDCIHHNFMWAYVRTAQLEGLHVQLPPTIYLRLLDHEWQRINSFTATLDRSRVNVLMETEGHSSQSWLNQSWIRPIMDILYQRYGGRVNLLISKGGEETAEIAQVRNLWPGRIHLLNDLSLREVAGVFNSCDVFIGCSSGTSNACHANFCRRDTQWFESVKSTVWDSRPLRPAGKHISYSEDPAHFFAMLRDNLQ